MKNFVVAAVLSFLAVPAALAQSSDRPATCQDVFNQVTTLTHDQSNPEYEKGLRGKIARLEDSAPDFGSRLHALKPKPSLDYSAEADLLSQAEQNGSEAPGLHLIDFFSKVKQRRAGASMESVKEILSDGDKNMTFCKFKGNPLDTRDPESYRLWHEKTMLEFVIQRLPNVDQNVAPSTSMMPAGTIADDNPKAQLLKRLGGYMGQLNAAPGANEATR